MAGPVIRYAPIKTPLFGPDGNFTRPWLQWFNQLLLGIQVADSNQVALAFVADPRAAQQDDLAALWAADSRAAATAADIADQAVVVGFGADERGLVQQQLADMAVAAAFASGYSGEESARIGSLETLVAEIQEATGQIPAGPSITFDTHANRLLSNPANFPVGSLWIESDRHVTYACKLDTVTSHVNQWYYADGTYVDASANRPVLGAYDDGYPFESSNHFVTWKYNAAGAYWVYISGEDNGTLAAIGTAGGAGGPTVHDVGMLYGANDVGHRFLWTGANWAFAGGDPGSGWTTFTPGGALGFFVPIGSSGGSATITLPIGTTTSQLYGAWTSPITGATLYVRI